MLLSWCLVRVFVFVASGNLMRSGIEDVASDAWSDHGVLGERDAALARSPSNATIAISSSEEGGYSDVSISGQGAQPPTLEALGSDGYQSDLSEEGHMLPASQTTPAINVAPLPSAADATYRGRGRRKGTTGSRDYKRLCRELGAGPSGPFVVQPWSKERQLVAARQARADKRTSALEESSAPGTAIAPEMVPLHDFFQRGVHVSQGIQKRALQLFGHFASKDATETTEGQPDGDYVKSAAYMIETRCQTNKPISYTWAAEAQIARVPAKSLQERFLEMGALIEIGCRSSWTSLFRMLLYEYRVRRIVLRLFLRGIRSDATPIPMRVDDGSTGDFANELSDLLGAEEFEEFQANILAKASSTKTKQIAKVIQAEYRIAILYEETATKVLKHLSGHVTTPLQYTDFGTAECLRAAEQQQIAIDGADGGFSLPGKRQGLQR